MKSFLSKARFGVLALLAVIASVLPIATFAAAAARVYDFAYGWVTNARQNLALNANTLTGLIPTLYESLDVVSRELVGIIPAVTRDTQVARAAKGQTVNSPVAPAVAAADITPGVTAPNDGDQVIGALPMTISKSRYVPIRWNGEEQMGLASGPGYRGILADQFTQAFRTLVNEIEGDLVAVGYKNASRAYGTPGTAPFGTAGDLSDIAQMAMILDDNGAPVGNRHLVLGSAAMANLRGKQNVLFKVNEAGTDELLRMGTIGMLEGFALHNSAAVKSFVKGTGASYTTNTAGYAVGATQITLITGTGTVNAGDVVTFAGDTNKYDVVAGVAAPGVITIGAPGLRQAIPASATAMTVGNSYTPNLAFTSNAMVLATRLPAVPVDLNGVASDMADDRVTVQDPVSGIAFEISTYRQYRQIKFEVGIAWGVANFKQEHTSILQG